MLKTVLKLKIGEFDIVFKFEILNFKLWLSSASTPASLTLAMV